MKQRDKYKSLYDSLVQLEETKSKFTVSDLSISTNYKRATLAVYIRNRLKNRFLFTEDGLNYVVIGLKNIQYKDFTDFMSQKDISRSQNEIEKRLQDKSFESFALAIEIYNKPLVTYRIEGFLILIINAWELLLKAVIIRIKGEDSIYYKDSRKSISISDAIDRILVTEDDALKKNLEFLIRLRDQAVHLVIPAIQGSLSRLFQASIINYLKYTEKYEIQSDIDFKGLGLLSLVTNISDSNIQSIKVDYGDMTAEAVEHFLTDFNDVEESLHSLDFSIPVSYHYVLTDKESDGDIKVQLTKSGPIARIIEVPKDPERTHPYRSIDLIDQVNVYLNSIGLSQISKNDLYAIIYAEKVRNEKSNRYYYRMDNPITHRYSADFCDLIKKKLFENSSYLSSCVRKYKERNIKKKDA